MPPKRRGDRSADADADDMRRRLIHNRLHGPHRYRASDSCEPPGAPSHGPAAPPPAPPGSPPDAGRPADAPRRT